MMGNMRFVVSQRIAHPTHVIITGLEDTNLEPLLPLSGIPACDLDTNPVVDVGLSSPGGTPHNGFNLFFLATT